MAARPLTLSIALGSLAFGASALAANDGTCPANDPGPLAALSDASAAASFVPPPSSALVFRVEDGAWVNRVEGVSGGNATLFAGAPVELVSAASRFPTCGNSNVTAYVRTDDGQTITVPMTSGDRMLNRVGWFTMPSGATSAQVWFKSESADEEGNHCVEWDSNFGANYRFDVTPFQPVGVSFGADAAAAPVLDAPLTAGNALVVHYDPARLTGCRTSYMGHDTWNIIAHAKFDDGHVYDSPVVSNVGAVSSGPAVFAIPEGATHAQVWFENDGYYPGSPTCTAWDSRYGANYDLR